MARGIVNPGSTLHLAGGRPSSIIDNLTFGAMFWMSGTATDQNARFGYSNTAGGIGMVYNGASPTFLHGEFPLISFFGGFTYPVSTWFSAMLRRLSGTAQMFLNGVATGSAWTDTPDAPADDFFGTSVFFNGGASYELRCAEAFFYEAALTDAQVLQIGTGTCPMAVRLANLVTHTHLYGHESPEPDSLGTFPQTVGAGYVGSTHPPIALPQHGAGCFRRRGR